MLIRKVFITLLLLLNVGVPAPSSTADKVEEPKQRNSQYLAMIKQSVPIITALELHALLNAPSPPVLLDSRREVEFYVSHLSNARCVGYRHFSLHKIKDLPKESVIVVYCSLGIRSEKIAVKLKEAGYRNVHNLLGGLFEWVNLGFPVYDAKERPTPMVHAYSKKWGKWLLRGKKVYQIKPHRGERK